jgi:hypothetical protein
MAQKQELEINIGEDGTVTVNVLGARGSSCLDLTKDLEESLGVVVDREKKPSFYEQDDPQRVKIAGEQG